MTDETIKQRLEYLRGEIDAERISYGELAELQGLAAHIEPGDVQLLEWAGVPEFPEDAKSGIWRWTVEGRQDGHGTFERSYEDSGLLPAELAGEVVEWLAQKSPIWDNLDTDHRFTITIEPVNTLEANDA